MASLVTRLHWHFVSKLNISLNGYHVFVCVEMTRVGATINVFQAHVTQSNCHLSFANIWAQTTARFHPGSRNGDLAALVPIIVPKFLHCVTRCDESTSHFMSYVGKNDVKRICPVFI